MCGFKSFSFCRIWFLVDFFYLLVFPRLVYLLIEEPRHLVFSNLAMYSCGQAGRQAGNTRTMVMKTQGAFSIGVVHLEPGDIIINIVHTCGFT